ncbi:MAG: Dihydroorotase (EC [uncultured Thiotrichaceae bacterium]|uniref:Dihydroorotase (EC) n=1 Tax=uncultured Thiotrichaceae bacterium TaxID=298394 RepID=A0A6S6TX48_9GAMM|nr:MAG: Dihydroorotase (EC [uncultured Thiotrichaceae bacterium]
MKRKAIINAHVIDPVLGLDGVSNIYIKGKNIEHVGEQAPEKFTADITVDANGLYAFPGITDLAVYLREPGQERKGTIESELEAAVSAGVTSVVCMPEPACPIDNMPMVNLMRKRIKAEKKARGIFIGAATQELKGKKLTNMGGLKFAQCVGVSNQREPFQDMRSLRLAIEYAATFNLPLYFHPIDPALSPEGGVHEGAIATRMGLPAIPAAAEMTMIASILALLEELQTPVHLCRISAASSVDLIRRAKGRGLPVTADVAAHQLFLTDMDISDYNPLCHVQPPLRGERDKEALRAGLVDGTIDAICSDHQPHDIDAKLAPFQQTEPGISGIETLLPLTMRLVEEGVLTRLQAIQLLSTNPANITNRSRGSLKKGSSADIVLYDPNETWEVDVEQLSSKGKNTPFQGWSFTGQVEKTYVKGKQVFNR